MVRINGKRRGGAVMIANGKRVPIRAGIDASSVDDLFVLGEEIASYDPVTLAIAYKTIETAFMCINARSNMAGNVTVKTIAPNGDTYDPKQTPASSFVDNAQVMLWHAVASKLIFGAYYFLKLTNDYGYPTGLAWCNPINVLPDISGPTASVVKGYWIQTDAGRLYYDASKVIASRSFNPLDQLDGQSTLEVAMTRGKVSLNIGRFGAAWFRNSARPDMIVTYGQHLDADERDQLRGYWERLFKGVRNAFRTAFLGGEDIRVTPLTGTTNPVDAAMVETERQADLKVCAVFNVNPLLVGLAQAADPLSAANTITAITRNAMQAVAIPDVKGILGALNEQWLHRDFGGRDYTLVVDDAALMSEAAGTGDRVVTATGAAGRVMTLNESRKYVGLPPADGAIQMAPDWPLALWQGGVTTRNETRRAVGLPEVSQDGFIFDVDPRAQPAPAPVDPFAGLLPPAQGNLLPAETRRVITVDALTSDYQQAIHNRAALAELQAWQKKVKRRGTQVPFAAAAIPDDVQREVRSGLQEGLPYTGVFARARAKLRAAARITGLDDDDDSDGDPETYWQDYDALLADIGDLYLSAYAEAAWQVLAPQVSHGLSSQTIMEAFKSQEDRFAALMVGTVDEPGPVLKLWIAGAFAGQKSLEATAAATIQRAINKTLRAEPKGRKPKVLPTASVTVQVDWTQHNQGAALAAKSYVYDLITNVTKAQVKEIANAITESIKLGTDQKSLRRELDKIVNNPVKARLIAQTESTRIYALGAANTYRNQGVEEVKWSTAFDKRVCRICGPLHGRVGKLNQPNMVTSNQSDVGSFVHPDTKEVYSLPAHPGCRCWIKPIMSKLSAMDDIVAPPTPPVAPPPVIEKPIVDKPAPKPRKPKKAVNPEVAVEGEKNPAAASKTLRELPIKEALEQDRIDPDELFKGVKVDYDKLEEARTALYHADNDEIERHDEIDRLRGELINLGLSEEERDPPVLPRLATPQEVERRIKEYQAKIDAYTGERAGAVKVRMSMMLKLEKERYQLRQKRSEHQRTVAELEGRVKQKMVEALRAGPDFKPAIYYTNKIKSEELEEVKERAQAGFDFLGAVVDPTTINQSKPIAVSTTDIGRAHCRGNELHMPAGAPIDTYIHEMGHAMEYNNEHWHERAVEYFKYRWLKRNEYLAKKNLPPAQPQVIGGSGLSGNGVNREEYGVSGIIGGLTTGRENDYAARIYTQDPTQAKNLKPETVTAKNLRSTELISMGIQALYNDPIRFARDSQDYFQFIVKLLRGVI